MRMVKAAMGHVRMVGRAAALRAAGCSMTPNRAHPVAASGDHTLQTQRGKQGLPSMAAERAAAMLARTSTSSKLHFPKSFTSSAGAAMLQRRLTGDCRLPKGPSARCCCFWPPPKPWHAYACDLYFSLRAVHRFQIVFDRRLRKTRFIVHFVAQIIRQFHPVPPSPHGA